MTLIPYNRLLYRIGTEKSTDRLAAFAVESGKIEGEDTRMKDYEALMLALQAEKIDAATLFAIHAKYAEGSKLEAREQGAYRAGQVYVGRHVPPPATEIKKLMDDWLMWYVTDMTDSYRSHCLFESIHPFADFNGRVGRALWLRKAIGEGYDCSLGFLHKFYYQTLSNFR